MGKRVNDHYCERCGHSVVAVRPNPLWRVASVAALAFYAVLVFASGASGMGIAFVPVVVFCLGAMVLGPLNERASEPPRCPDCRCVVTARPNAPARVDAIAQAPRRRAA